MNKFVLTLALILSLFLSPAGTSVAFANSNANCPAGTTPFHDDETGVWVCQHPTVTLVNGHPAYDYAADCVPGTVQEFKIPHKNDSGFRIVRQVCNANYTGPVGHALDHIVTGY